MSDDLTKLRAAAEAAGMRLPLRYDASDERLGRFREKFAVNASTGCCAPPGKLCPHDDPALAALEVDRG